MHKSVLPVHCKNKQFSGDLYQYVGYNINPASALCLVPCISKKVTAPSFWWRRSHSVMLDIQPYSWRRAAPLWLPSVRVLWKLAPAHEVLGQVALVCCFRSHKLQSQPCFGGVCVDFRWLIEHHCFCSSLYIGSVAPKFMYFDCTN